MVYRMPFELIGYHLDYYVGSKYVGSLPTQPDRPDYGYKGGRTHTLESDIKLKGKTIKKGTTVRTELIPLCGRIKS